MAVIKADLSHSHANELIRFIAKSRTFKYPEGFGKVIVFLNYIKNYIIKNDLSDSMQFEFRCYGEIEYYNLLDYADINGKYWRKFKEGRYLLNVYAKKEDLTQREQCFFDHFQREFLYLLHSLERYMENNYTEPRWKTILRELKKGQTD